MRFEPLVNQIYTVAVNEANLQSHEFVTPEHFLYATLMFEAGRGRLAEAGGNASQILTDLTFYFMGNMRLSNAQPKESLAFTQMFRIATDCAKSNRRDEVLLEDVLFSLFNIGDCFAAHTMEQNGAAEMRLANFDKNRLFWNEMEDYLEYDEEDEREAIMPNPAPMPADGDEENNESFLAKYATNLTQMARDGSLQTPLIGREGEIAEIALILSRRIKNNPVLVGDPGVGKTAIIEGIARLVAENKIPAALAGANIFHIDMSIMLAGTKYRGDFEARLLRVLDEAAALTAPIIYIDEIHTIMGAGATSTGNIDAAAIIKPAMTRGNLRFIGCTTHEEFRRHMEKDRGMMRRFQRVDISEPSIEKAYEMLNGSISEYSDFHCVSYDDDALRAACRLARRYLPERKLPDSAFDIIDQAGAAARSDKAQTVDIAGVERIVAKISKLPESRIGDDERAALGGLEKTLSTQIFGQDDAIGAVCAAVLANRSGLAEPDRPIASLLFVGPTGVGKTEVAKQLSAALGIELVRFDMSEYQESHSVAKLIGSPPGYVGFDHGGLLTSAIRKTPHCVLLLDEIEKAHISIMNLLLQVMDYGMLTDNAGQKANFRNVVLIMTSNAGARELGRQAVGFSGGPNAPAQDAEINRIFPPEFRNRLDDICKFNPLNAHMARLIAERAINDLSAKLAHRKIRLNPDSALIEHIAQRGVGAEYGAREIMRIVQRDIKRQLAQALLFGNIADNTPLRLSQTPDGKISLSPEADYEFN